MSWRPPPAARKEARKLGIVLGAACSLIALLAASCQVAQASPSLPPEFRRALAIVPPDSESLLGTLKPFAVPKPRPGRQGVELVDDFLRSSLLGTVLTSKSSRHLETLTQIEVVWGLFAKRAQEVRTVPGSRIIELGVHPYESVAIARFRKPLPPAFLDAVRSAMRSEIRNGVEVFRSTTEPIAIAIPQPDLLVSVSMLSTSEAMLDDVTLRIAKPGGDYLFQSADAAWSLTDLDSTFWGLRKPDARERQRKDIGARDWVLFSYDSDKPQSARFRSLPSGAPPASGNPWLELSASQTRGDLGLVTRTEITARYVETTMECLPSHKDRCLLFPVLLEALGIMIWI